MKKVAYSFILTILFSIGSSLDANALNECQPGGLANVYCPYWDVTYEVTAGFWPWSDPTISITCTTGGEFKCEKQTQPV
ncbi:hypothetical protein [Algoriphagus antarcticus]|uniref:Uncharacterized protein n=1 Tax=Algoriphagus antarcticus TaxID=238540 RepID=A0A3E0DET7_9BACT|nr:hypothetical protein [Algoriphagus antarcticus]REG81124.1 hypothetical protein C8N25_12969 [Algoriphagus antarcticus]